MSKALIVFVLLAITALCFADAGFEAFAKKLMAVVKSKLAKKTAETFADTELSMVSCKHLCAVRKTKDCLETCTAQQRTMLKKWHNHNSNKTPLFTRGRKHAETLSELRFVPCDRVCESKPAAEKQSCVKSCQKSQAEMTRRWLHQNKQLVKKQEKKQEKTLSDLRFVPCPRFCASSKNAEECVKECKKRQAETTKKWREMINKSKKNQKKQEQALSDLRFVPCPTICKNDKNKEKCINECNEKQREIGRKWAEKYILKKKVQSLSDLSFMPCSRVCKDRTDTEACTKACKQRQMEALKRWNDRNKKLREKYLNKKPATSAAPAKTLSEADLSLIPCNMVCAKKENKDKCMTECKEKNMKASKWWSDMIKRRREEFEKKKQNTTSSDSDLSLVPCTRVCENGEAACLNTCQENQRKALANWAEMNKKIRQEFPKQPNALADAELRFVPCDHLCAKDQKSNDKCIETCKASQAEYTKKWLGMTNKKDKPLTFGDAELKFVPCRNVCDRKKQADEKISLQECLEKCSADQKRISQNWLNGPYCRRNCAADKVNECITKGRSVCPAKTA